MVYCKSITFDEPQWDNLIQLSNTASFFQQRQWLRIWVENFPIDHEIVGVFDNEKLIGIIPISFNTERVNLLGTTPVLGKEQVCDFGDTVCLPEYEKIVWTKGIEYLSKKYPGKTLSLDFIKENSPSFLILNTLYNNALVTATSPYINLPKSWEGYLEVLKKKDRHELKRKLRRLETVKYRVYQADSTEENQTQFISLMKQSAPEKEKFMTELMEKYFTTLLKTIDNERLVLWFMEIDSIPVAGVLAFKFKNQLLLYNSGMNLEYRQLSVGLLTKILLMKRGIEWGLNIFDFLQGNEPHKYDLGAVDNNLYQFNIVL